MKNNLIIIFILVIILILVGLTRIENFDNIQSEEPENNNHLNNLDEVNRQLANNLSNSTESSNSNSNSNSNGNQLNNVYIRNTELERAAKAIAQEYCPVGPDYNPDDFIKKTELKESCPKMPNLEDYILRSAIKPQQKCPACICPRITVNEGDVAVSNKCNTCLNKCNVENIKENSTEYKDIKNFCNHFVKCSPCTPAKMDKQTLDAIKKNLVSQLNCPPPQPCSINKDIFDLLDNLIKNKNNPKYTSLLKKIKEKVNKLNLNNININNLQQQILKEKQEKLKLLNIIKKIKEDQKKLSKQLLIEKEQKTTTLSPTTLSPTTLSPTTLSPTTTTTTSMDININNINHEENHGLTVAPSNINNLNKRARNINNNGDSSGDEDLIYPSNNYDKCKSAPLKYN